MTQFSQLFTNLFINLAIPVLSTVYKCHNVHIRDHQMIPERGTAAAHCSPLPQGMDQNHTGMMGQMQRTHFTTPSVCVTIIGTLTLTFLVLNEGLIEK